MLRKCYATGRLPTFWGCCYMLGMAFILGVFVQSRTLFFCLFLAALDIFWLTFRDCFSTSFFRKGRGCTGRRGHPRVSVYWSTTRKDPDCAGGGGGVGTPYGVLRCSMPPQGCFHAYIVPAKDSAINGLSTHHERARAANSRSV